MNKDYAIISCEEMIHLLKHKKIEIPTALRCIDGWLPEEKFIKDLTQKLIDLGIYESSDYVIVRFKTENNKYEVKENISIKISDIDPPFCLDTHATRFYKTKISAHIPFVDIGLNIGIDQIIDNTQKAEIEDILVNKFTIDIKDVSKHKVDVDKSRLHKNLTKFQRECPLPKVSFSHLNDIVTFAAVTPVNKDDEVACEKRYKNIERGLI